MAGRLKFNITFFTSNTTKLAHARHIAERIPVRIDGFKEKTYHATYVEPRVPSRSELLEASYRSAREQAAKARLGERQFFMLEDTSVRLEALSSEHAEIPGLDVKYWMKDRTLSSIEAEIAAHGGDRRATVRSDVLLHIPEYYQRMWEIDNEYLVFVGQQEGSVVLHEAEFETNPVYPWLDKKSFNRWFVPVGQSIPLSAMPISKANEFDFRRRSFGAMFDFLASKGMTTMSPKQDELELGDRYVDIVCGYTCAGKTTASLHLARASDYLHVEASDFMYLNYYIRHDVQSDISITTFAERALREKPEIAAEKIAEYLIEEGFPPTVISGFRSPKEIEWISAWLDRAKGRSSVIFIEAPEAIRYERMRRRNRIGDAQTLDKFRERDRLQRSMGLDLIAEGENTQLISNTRDLEAYRDAVVLAVGATENPGPVSIEGMIARVRLLPAVKLEEAILISLLAMWSDEESRGYHTTSQIAKLIGVTLDKRKHKDNVSRYFNQYFYPYYEIALVDGHRRYRLSNTGFGKALRTLRRLVGGRTLAT